MEASPLRLAGASGSPADWPFANDHARHAGVKVGPLGLRLSADAAPATPPGARTRMPTRRAVPRAPRAPRPDRRRRRAPNDLEIVGELTAIGQKPPARPR